MKVSLSIFFRNLDALCARANPGLAAVAIVLGIAVTGLAVERAEENLPSLGEDAALSLLELP